MMRHPVWHSLLLGFLLTQGGCRDAELDPITEASSAMVIVNSTGMVLGLFAILHVQPVNWSSEDAAKKDALAGIHSFISLFARCVKATTEGETLVIVIENCETQVFKGGSGNIRLTAQADFSSSPKRLNFVYDVEGFGGDGLLLDGQVSIQQQEGTAVVGIGTNVHSRSDPPVIYQTDGSLIRMGEDPLNICVIADQQCYSEFQEVKITTQFKGVEFCIDTERCPSGGSVRVAGQHLQTIRFGGGLAILEGESGEATDLSDRCLPEERWTLLPGI